MKYLTLKEAACLCDVHPRTILRWIKSGQIKADRMGKTGRYHIAEDQIPQFLRKGGE